MTALTHRALPQDPGIAHLGAAERQSVAEGWRRRARNELSTSTVFASLTRSLVAFGAPHETVLACAEAVADEVRHAEICVRVARAYCAEVRPPDPSPVTEAPAIEEASDIGALYFAVQQSCVNEGVASVYLQRCLDQTSRPLARAALRDILQDEIHHTRFGWSLLASDLATPSFRRALADALPVMLERVAGAWVSGGGGGHAVDVPLGHGVITQADIADVVRQAFAGLVLPGFDAVGVDTKLARAWAANRFAEHWRRECAQAHTPVRGEAGRRGGAQ